MVDTLADRDAFEQFIMLSVVELTETGQTPVHSYDVAQTAKDHLDDIERSPFGGVERQAVITALQHLADDGLLEKTRAESPTGKGRPGYTLAVQPGKVIQAIEESPDLGSYAEQLQAADD